MCIVIVVCIISVKLCVLGWSNWRKAFEENVTFLGRLCGGGGEGYKAQERLSGTWIYLKAGTWRYLKANMDT